MGPRTLLAARSHGTVISSGPIVHESRAHVMYDCFFPPSVKPLQPPKLSRAVAGGERASIHVRHPARSWDQFGPRDRAHAKGGARLAALGLALP